MSLKLFKILEQFHKIGVCLCVIAKNENLYVKEFIEHYIKIGYNHIFIYDNNDVNGEHFDNIIKKYIQKGLVSIINYRGRGLNTKPIFDAYKDCYEKNNRKYDWLSFFDMDEFLEIPKKRKIQKFLKDKRFKDCQNIKINWVLCDNKEALFYEDKPLQKRIKTPNLNYSVNRHIKSTVRGNLSENYWLKMGTPHTSSNKFISCSSSGKIIKGDSPFNEPPEYFEAYLKHYFYKSFEEFCIKIMRGKCDHSIDKSYLIKLKIIKNIYLENKNNKDKLFIMKKIFKTDLDKIINITK